MHNFTNFEKGCTGATYAFYVFDCSELNKRSLSIYILILIQFRLLYKQCINYYLYNLKIAIYNLETALFNLMWESTLEVLNLYASNID